MHRMKMKPLGDNFQEHFSHLMHNAEGIVERQHASKMSVYVRNFFALMLQAVIVLHIVPLPKVQRVAMDKWVALNIPKLRAFNLIIF